MDPRTSALLAWYEANRRDLPWRRTADPYCIWVSEIMLQQTRVEAVIPYYQRFLARFPTALALADALEEDVLKLWQGLGYYSRARNLHRGAQYIRDALGGSLPGTFQAWLQVPGVGRYTAGAVASIACGEAVPAVDGNVMRVAARLFARGEDIVQPRTRLLVEELVRPLIPPGQTAAFTQALMELGACVCVPNPRCLACPLLGQCRARAQGLEHELPVKTKKASQRNVSRTVLIARRGEEVLLRQRPRRGLLAGLWEFPGWEEGEEPLPLAWGWSAPLLPILEATHTFTHLRWQMTGMLCKLDAAAPPPENCRWVPVAALTDYAIPTAMRPFVEYVNQNSR